MPVVLFVRDVMTWCHAAFPHCLAAVCLVFLEFLVGVVLAAQHFLIDEFSSAIGGKTMVEERVLIHERLEHLDAAALAKAFIDGGVARDRAIILGPIIKMYLSGFFAMAQQQEGNRHEFDKKVLELYERSKRRNFAARKGEGGCCFSAERAIRESESEAKRELDNLVASKQDNDQGRLQLMGSVGHSMLTMVLEATCNVDELEAKNIAKLVLPQILEGGGSSEEA